MAHLAIRTSTCGVPEDEHSGCDCCPNGELAYRLRDLVKSDSTKVVINCAGRTRSIVGAQTLINFGVKNPVLRLKMAPRAGC